MGEYRLVDDGGAVIATFSAVDDDAARGKGRRAAQQHLTTTRTFVVQRDRAGTWTEVCAWVTRPPYQRNASRAGTDRRS